MKAVSFLSTLHTVFRRMQSSLTGFTRKDIISSIFSAERLLKNERERGSISVCTGPRDFLSRACVHPALWKLVHPTSNVSGRGLEFYIILFGEMYPVKIIWPGPYRKKWEWESFFDATTPERYEQVKDLALAILPNKDLGFCYKERALQLWKKQFSGQMREIDVKPLLSKALGDLKSEMEKLFFQDRDVSHVATSKEAIDALLWCQVTGFLSLSQHTLLVQHFVKHGLLSAEESIRDHLFENLQQRFSPDESKLVQDMRELVLELADRVVEPVIKCDPGFSHECQICMSEPATNVASPCGHPVLCNGCKDEVKLMSCPICRKPITRLVQLQVQCDIGKYVIDPCGHSVLQDDSKAPPTHCPICMTEVTAVIKLY